MKGLTLYQPWASLVATGAKKIETRNWATKYRGPVAIHASVNKTYAAQHCGDPLMRQALGGLSPFDLPRGAIVAVANLVGLVSTEILDRHDRTWAWTSPPGRRYEFVLTDQERTFGDYSSGRYAWLLADVRPLARPIPYLGTHRLWDVVAAAQLLIQV